METGKLGRQRRMPRHLRAERAQVLVNLRLRELRRFARERAARRGNRRALRAAVTADARTTQPRKPTAAAVTRRGRGGDAAEGRPGSGAVAAVVGRAGSVRPRILKLAARRCGVEPTAPTIGLGRSTAGRAIPSPPDPSIRCARVGRGARGVVLAASPGAARLSSPAARPREPTSGELAAHRRGERRAARVVRGVEPAGRERRAEAEAPARLGRPRLGHRARAGGRASQRVRRRGGGGRKGGYC